MDQTRFVIYGAVGAAIAGLAWAGLSIGLFYVLIMLIGVLLGSTLLAKPAVPNGLAAPAAYVNVTVLPWAIGMLLGGAGSDGAVADLVIAVFLGTPFFVIWMLAAQIVLIFRGERPGPAAG